MARAASPETLLIGTRRVIEATLEVGCGPE
jgi:hypothetical protein